MKRHADGLPHNYGLKPSRCKRLPVRGSRACAEAARPREGQMSICLRRREFIAGLGGAAAAWPLAVRAQQRAMPVIAYLSPRTAESDASMLVSVRRGLGDVGYTEGRNVRIEYRFADGRYDRVSGQLTDLTQRKVGVIVLVGFFVNEELLEQVRASPIPIVFGTGNDPVELGLVASMNRPGGNVTGVNVLGGELSGKYLGLLHDLVPKAATIAVLVDPSVRIAVSLRDAREAAAVLGQKLLVLEASTAEEIDAQFARLDQEPADAMLVISSPFFVTRAGQIAALAARHRIPAIYARREYAEAGGLMSYGFNVAEVYRELGRYAGRILNGEKPADLPVIQPTKFELVVNVKAAKALNFEFPPLIRALATEVIE
jgi:putative ABC transport system substrate-binding protein